MDLTQIPGLSSFIRETIHSILGPMMYDPNVFTLNLEQLLSGAPIDTAVGVIKVTVNSARSIGANKIGGGTPDPYVTFGINNSTQLARTMQKSST
jgi:Ca2+-dependent lipid-binding protein